MGLIVMGTPRQEAIRFDAHYAWRKGALDAKAPSNGTDRHLA
jgi:hypothetical protein